jgi:hypothetical protein
MALKYNRLLKAEKVIMYLGFIAYIEVKYMSHIVPKMGVRKWKYTALRLLHYL